MLPCCDLCYRKYIKEDGTLDKKKYESLKRQLKVESKKACMCGCHKKGINILH